MSGKAWRGTARVTITPFAPFSPAVRQGINREAERLGAFFGAESEVVFESQ